MATKKQNKRPAREKIREQQAHASMEIALWEHQESQYTKTLKTSQSSVIIQQETTTFHTPMASPLEQIASQSTAKPPVTPKSPQPKEPALSGPASTLVLSSDGKLTTSEYPHEWMKRAATRSAQDMSLFFLFMLVLFALIGILGQ